MFVDFRQNTRFVKLIKPTSYERTKEKAALLQPKLQVKAALILIKEILNLKITPYLTLKGYAELCILCDDRIGGGSKLLLCECALLGNEGES